MKQTYLKNKFWLLVNLVLIIFASFCQFTALADPINPDALTIRGATQFEESIDSPQLDLISPFAPYVQCSPNGGAFSTLPNSTYPTANCTNYQLASFSGYSVGTLLKITLCAHYGLSDGNDFGVIDQNGVFNNLLDRTVLPGESTEILLSPSNTYQFAVEAWGNGATKGARFLNGSVDAQNIGQFSAIIAQRVTTSGSVTLPRGSPIDPRPTPVFPERGPITCDFKAGDTLLFIEDTLPADSPVPPAPGGFYPSDRDYNDLIVVVHAEQMQPDVIPQLSCTARKSATEYSAYFGYYNPNSQTSVLPVSTSVFHTNYFSPAPLDRNQPTEFPFGSNPFAVKVDFSGTAPIWFLGRTNTVAANTSFTQRCAPTCAVLSPINFNSCERKRILNGNASTTLNNSGQFSSVSWTTTCPGTLTNGNTLTPTLTLDESVLDVSAKRTCTATLTVTDDTSFGGATEIRNESCPVTIGYGPCTSDCAGTPNGTVEIDECGVCGGDGSSCLDCLGVPNGGTKVDQCGACGGDNSTCIDCRGIPNGGSVYDACGHCGGDGSLCALSCVGGKVDQCGVCNGDSTKCQDCAGYTNGTNKVDPCGVCGGDGSSCHPNQCVKLPTPLIITPDLKGQIRELTTRARRYISEARVCLRESRAATNKKLRDIELDSNRALQIVRGEFGGSEEICPENQCISSSTVAPKPFLTRLVTNIYSRSATAQRTVAKCRKPLLGRTVISSREILERILKDIKKLPRKRTICVGD